MKIDRVDIHNFKGLEAVTLDNCGRINALVGRNNSGKSSILHAIDMAGLALGVNDWNRFQPKVEIQDMFSDVGAFSITLGYEDHSEISITANPGYSPIKTPEPTDEQRFQSILIWPDVGAGMLQRQHRTPRWIIQQVENRNYALVNSLQILFAIKYFAKRNERGLTLDDYHDILEQIKFYFPEIEQVDSNRTPDDIATLTYTEYGKTLDILYSGSGLKHFIDVLLKTVVSQADVVLLDEPEMGLHPDLQRRFIGYLDKMSKEKNIQVFMATHSQVLLNYADTLTYYRVVNSKGTRAVIPVPNDAIQTLLSDMGLRPSDVFNQDICLLVEGSSDVVFFEHIIRNLYKEDFENVAVGVLQYGGSSADGIISGSIDVSNIVPAQKYTYWVRDRDQKPTSRPSRNATRFKNALNRQGLPCHILGRREIEYYYPESVLVAAQQGDTQREEAVRRILHSDQSHKFCKAAKAEGVCVPSGKYLRELLKDHLNDKAQIDQEIRNIVEEVLLTWKREILGEGEDPEQRASPSVLPTTPSAR